MFSSPVQSVVHSPLNLYADIQDPLVRLVPIYQVELMHQPGKLCGTVADFSPCCNSVVMRTI